MRRFVAGLAVGLVLGSATAALAASIMGTGYLMGWSIIYSGETICYDPYVWASQQIEC